MINNKAIIVIFGGTGDLAYRKLLPALMNLEEEGRLPSNFEVVAVGRKPFTTDSYCEEIGRRIEKAFTLKERTHYYQLSFDDQEGYRRLNISLEAIDYSRSIGGNRLFYFATAPKYFEIISRHLREVGMLHQQNSWQRIMIEKPFGYDLESAKKLNQILCDAVGEKNIYRIDHYLGKEMLQNIIYIRFSNILFEKLWNRESIDNIQLTVSENIGIEGRGPYYDQSGALRDMVQNHLFQMVALLTMDRPSSFDPENIRNEKVKMLKSLKPFDETHIKEQVVFGQYEGNDEVRSYTEEIGVSPVSTTETFVGLKVYIDSSRWQGVPIYIKTGKRLEKKEAYVTVEFKSNGSGDPFFGGAQQANILGIRIQPFEGIYLRFNIKEPGHLNKMVPASSDYCHNCDINYRSPEAYERLILDGIQGDASLFTRWDEVEASWQFIDQLTSICCLQKRSLMHMYESGSDGPEAFSRLIENEEKVWWSF